MQFPPLSVGLPAWASAGRLSGLIQAGLLAHSIYERHQQFREQRRKNRSYTISIGEQDEIYLDVQAWLLDRIPSQDHRSLVASTDARTEYGLPHGYLDDDDKTAVAVRYRYSGRNSLRTRIGGHPIQVWVDRDEGGDPGERRLYKKDEQIVFEAESQAGLAILKSVIEEIARTKGPRSGPRVFTATKWSSWQRSTSLAARDLSTVVLAQGQMERLSADLDRFLGAEDVYGRIGIPWHRGYLFSGPPGSGKTSAIRALASAHNLDVYYAPLASLGSDIDLVQLLSVIPDRSVLLLEDIDGSKAAVSRDDSGPERVSSSGLLNVLDGVTTPHGLITAMTTNYRDRLDPALLRRCDVIEEIGYLTDEQMVRLVSVMTGRTGPLPSLGSRQVVPVTLVELVKRHITDPDAARAAIVDYLRRDPLDLAA